MNKKITDIIKIIGGESNIPNKEEIITDKYIDAGVGDKKTQIFIAPNEKENVLKKYIIIKNKDNND